MEKEFTKKSNSFTLDLYSMGIYIHVPTFLLLQRKDRPEMWKIILLIYFLILVSCQGDYHRLNKSEIKLNKNFNFA